ncbi:hypothetical protein D3C72_655350 [compost metagenome]
MGVTARCGRWRHCRSAGHPHLRRIRGASSPLEGEGRFRREDCDDETLARGAHNTLQPSSRQAASTLGTGRPTTLEYSPRISETKIEAIP